MSACREVHRVIESYLKHGDLGRFVDEMAGAINQGYDLCPDVQEKFGIKDGIKEVMNDTA